MFPRIHLRIFRSTYYRTLQRQKQPLFDFATCQILYYNLQLSIYRQISAIFRLRLLRLFVEVSNKRIMKTQKISDFRFSWLERSDFNECSRWKVSNCQSRSYYGLQLQESHHKSGPFILSKIDNFHVLGSQAYSYLKQNIVQKIFTQGWP